MTYADEYHSLVNPDRVLILRSSGDGAGHVTHKLLCGHCATYPVGDDRALYGGGTRPHHVPCPTCKENRDA
jgi:hypothetical protein